MLIDILIEVELYITLSFALVFYAEFSDWGCTAVDCAEIFIFPLVMTQGRY